jgi:hypothetical protein
MTYTDPCNSCQYMNQACAFILDGKRFEDACMDKQVWMRQRIKISEGEPE